MTLLEDLKTTKPDQQTDQVIKEYTQIPSEIEELELPSLEGLYGFKDWGGIRGAFKHRFQSFDKLLLRIHYKRRAQLSEQERACIIRFLCTGYLISNDVRYFNEFLWFHNQGAPELFRAMLCRFKGNLYDNIHHTNPLADSKEVEDWIQEVNTTCEKAGPDKKELKIALLGTPSTFTGLYDRIKKMGIDPKVFYFTTRKEPLKRWLRSIGFISKLYFLAKGCGLPYVTVKNKPRDVAIKCILQKENLDLAVHRLGFILKENILNPFTLGVLNDHLGILPFIRGRNTLEYSLLFDFPVGATVHFADQGVDTGDILTITTYPKESFQSVEQMKNQFMALGDERIYHVIEHLSARKFNRIENQGDKGQQFFVMHPLLREYVDHAVLNAPIN